MNRIPSDVSLNHLTALENMTGHAQDSSEHFRLPGLSSALKVCVLDSGAGNECTRVDYQVCESDMGVLGFRASPPPPSRNLYFIMHKMQLMGSGYVYACVCVMMFVPKIDLFIEMLCH